MGRDWSVCPVNSWSQKYRSREMVLPKFGGESCPDGALNDTDWCRNTDLTVKVDCRLAQWSVWSECTTKCGPGTQEQTRDFELEASNGGLPCTATLRRLRTC